MTSPALNPSVRHNRTLAFFSRWMRDDPRAALALAYLFALALLAVLAPIIAPHSPTDQDLDAILMNSSANHLLGTDDLGRDVLSRLLHGAPVSLFASLLAVSIGVMLGVPIGVSAGFLGGRYDDVIGRMIDTLSSFPGLVLAIGVTGALGVGLMNSMTAVGIVFSPEIARLARAQTLIVKNELYVDAARTFGAGPGRLIWRHVLPNAMQPVIVQATLLLAIALLVESSLSFLGLGVQPPFPSWGGMLARGFANMEIAPGQVYSPGIAILLTALAFNTLGGSLGRALDPRSRPRQAG